MRMQIYALGPRTGVRSAEGDGEKMTSDDELYQPFHRALWADLENGETFPNKRPLLAHYTSISTLDAIMSNDEVWFSNPMFMNDVEELRFGMNEGLHALLRSETIRAACGDEPRYKALLDAFSGYFNRFAVEHAFDTYIVCLSKHEEPEDIDGRLSMWRGYGGNGDGAAIVFDVSKLAYNENSPLVLAPVDYLSTAKRREWITGKIDQAAGLIQAGAFPIEKLYLAAHALLERIKFFALFTKHDGFREEQEWRVVYMPERDKAGKLRDMFNYAVGPRGIEPKLRFKVGHIDGITAEDMSMEKVVKKIILGPSLSSDLAITAVKRMLTKNGKVELCDRVSASTTPYRTR
ncbi:DUF2971 domain-containing protein [Ralstonia soli]|uniref:DUF2971 domain-containing protein n=1 Tax=Ralstonia soli TaxID=2953896 RepID=A0ABT1AJD2_9RALS|nr:DUF2971 domain-containing protein [Ralstonia soli]MCO5398419.1 DUF2971 domain-containing protein [Ralstonia soli]